MHKRPQEKICPKDLTNIATTIPVKLVLIFYVLKKKSQIYKKERELAIQSWARVTTLICYRATETENNDKTDQRIWGLVASIFMRSYIPLTIREQRLFL